MKKKLKNILINTFPILLGVFFIWISLSKLTGEDFKHIKESFQSANYWWIGLSLVLGILSHLSRAYRWLFMLEPLGYKPKFLNSVMTVIITYLVNLGIPRAGEVSRAIAISKYENIPFQKAFGTIVAERVADLVMLFLIIAITLFAQYDFISKELEHKIPENPFIAIFTLAMLGVLALLFLRLIRVSDNLIFVKIRTFTEGLFQGIQSILTMKKKWAFIFHTFFIWLMYLLMFYVATFSFPETINLPISAVFVCFIVGAFSFAVTNGGVGSYPFGIQKALVLYGISSIPALSFGWVVWTSQTLMVLFFGGLSFIYLPIYNKKNLE